MKNINSYSSQSESPYKSLLVPTGWHILLYFVLGLLLLTFVNTRNIWRYFSSNVLQQTSLGDIIGERSPSLHNFLEKIPQARLLQILFWVFIGTTLYVLIWFFKNLLINARNDLVASEYIRPKNYSISNYWRPILIRKAYFCFTVILLIAYVYASTKLAFATSNLCFNSLTNFHLVHSSVIVGASVLMSSILIYVFVVVAKMVINSWRFIYLDL